MTSNRFNIRSPKTLSQISQTASLTVIVISLIVLAGWIFDIQILQSLIPGFVGMSPVTATAFIFSGLATWFLNYPTTKNWQSYAWQICSIAVTLIGVVMIIQILFQFDLNLGYHIADKAGRNNVADNHRLISPASAVNFVLIGFSLLMYNRKFFTISRAAISLTIIFAIFSLFDNILYSQSYLHPGTYYPMAFISAIVFVLNAAAYLSFYAIDWKGISLNFPNRFRYAWQPYLFSVVIIALAALLRLWPLQSLGLRTVWVTFYPAVMLAAIYGGFTSGLVATFLASFIALFLWPIFVDQPFIKDFGDWLSLSVFVITCTMISGLAEVMIRAREKVKYVNRQIENANVELENEIANRKAAEEEIQKLNRELEERVKERTAALQISEERYSSFFNTSRDCVFITSKDGRWIELNDAAVELFGYSSKEELMQVKIPDLYANAEDRAAHITNIIEQGYTKDYPVDLRKKDGTIINTLITSTVRYDADGNAIGFMGTIRDITAHKHAEEKIRNANRVYAVLSNINQAIVRIKDKETLFDEACRIAVDDGKFVMSWIGLIEQKTNKVVPAAFYGDTDDFLKSIDIDLNDEKLSRIPIVQAIKSGTHFVNNDVSKSSMAVPWHELAMKLGYKSSAAFPLKVFGKTIGAFMLYSNEQFFFDDDEVKLLDEMAMDISFAIEFMYIENERKEYENDLVKSLERYRSTLDTMLEGCQIIGFDWKYIYINDAAEKHNRRPKDELIGKRYMDMWPGIEETEVFGFIKRCMEERINQQMENEFIFPDGTPGWFELSIQTVPEGVFILSQDITERKRVENNERLAHEVLEHLNTIYDSETMIKTVIQSIKMSTGIEAVAIRLREGDDYPYYYTSGFGEKFVNAERYLCSYDKDGNIIRDENGDPLLECMCGNILCGRIDPAKSFFTEGGSFRSNNTTQLLATTTDSDRMARTRNRCNSAGYESVALIPLRSGNEIIGLLQLNDKRKNMFNEGMIPFFEGLSSSIGIALMRNKVQDEIKKFNIELEQKVTERTAQLENVNKELEAFSYSVSHDLRAPLRHIDGFIKMLQSSVKEKLDEKSNRYLGIISGAAKQMGQLIDDLLHFSKMGRTAISYAAIDMNNIVNDVKDEVMAAMQHRSIIWNISNLPNVRSDHSMIRIVWMNLLSNAVKYTSKVEKPVIVIDTFQNENELTFYIKDNGAGFDSNYVHKLFGVFQRLHSSEEFEGTGIGLATVRRIITRLGGKTWAEGLTGQGATFYFTLPTKIN